MLSRRLMQVSPAIYTRPSGAGIVPYESLTPQGTLNATANQMSSANQLSFLAGTFSFSDFAISSDYGVLFWTNVLGLRGSGIDKTIFQMVPNSSTKASSVPPQSTAPTGTNPLTLIRTGNSGSGGTIAPILSGFSILGTTQGHLYNGLNLFYGVNAQLTDIKIKGIPGNNSANPGETFGIDDYHGINTSLTRVEIDGTDTSGTRVAGTNIGLNFTNGFTATDVYTHGVGYGSGISLYHCTGTILYTRMHTTDNDIPLNFERNVCTITMTDCIISGNRSRTTDGTNKPVHIVLDSDLGSSTLTINDPTIEGGAPTPSNPLVITIHDTYGGATNLQLSSDVHLNLGGTARQDCLRFVTNETLVYG